MSSFNVNQDFLGEQGPIPLLDTTPWQVRLAKAIYAKTADPKLKSIFGPQGWNAGVINKLFALTQKAWLPGADRVMAMAAQTGVSRESVTVFLDLLPMYQGQDVVEGPVAVAEQLVKKVFTSTGKVVEGAGESGKTLPTILLVLAAGAAAYLFMAGKAGVSLIPGTVSVRKNPRRRRTPSKKELKRACRALGIECKSWAEYKRMAYARHVGSPDFD